MSPYFVHVGYVLTLAAFVTKDVLWLRGFLVVAQCIVTAYAWSIGALPIASWNALFACINTGWVIRILRERRAIELPAELREIYASHFRALSKPEFLRWWNQGETITGTDVLVHAGQAPAYLFFILDGTVSIRHDGVEVASLPAGFFIAEMSLLTGELPTASAVGSASARVRRWALPGLRALQTQNPTLWSKLQGVLGVDLVEKLRRSVPRPATAAPGA